MDDSIFNYQNRLRGSYKLLHLCQITQGSVTISPTNLWSHYGILCNTHLSHLWVMNLSTARLMVVIMCKHAFHVVVRARITNKVSQNIMYPHLGAAGSPYARTVTPQHPRPSVLPEPSVIFDSECSSLIAATSTDYDVLIKYSSSRTKRPCQGTSN